MDSRFLSDSFFVRFSRETIGVSSGTWDFLEVKSGLRGEDTAGTWSSSRARFWGREAGPGPGAGAGFVPPAGGVSGLSLDILNQLGRQDVVKLAKSTRTMSRHCFWERFGLPRKFGVSFGHDATS